MRRLENEDLFVVVSGEGECASVVTSMDRARAWLRAQFYGMPDDPRDEAETERWAHFSDPLNWSTCGDGREFEYEGRVEDGSTIRAFFVTDGRPM